jgi:DNA-binding transcriptional regulator YiaG
VVVRPADLLVSPADVRRWRTDVAGLRQVDAAAWFGVSVRTWRRWEHGTTLLHPAAARLIRAHLDSAAAFAVDGGAPSAQLAAS